MRTLLTNHRGAAVGGAAGIILLALVLVIYQSSGRSGGGGGAGSIESGKAFFTVDDGKTWFPDSRDKLPPFDHGGKPAYLVYVWTCDGGKTTFASHLLRYTPELHQKLLESQHNGGRNPPDSVERDEGTEVKLPGTGDTGWVKLTDRRADEVTTPHFKSGKTEDLRPVLP
jgi:hypothetical protein